MVLVSTSCKKNSSSNPNNNDNADVYLVGSTMAANGTYIATYWKNGIATELSDGTQNAFCFAITVKGTDVYVIGQSHNAAVYWKNGKEVDLNRDGLAEDINVSDGNIYAVGFGDTFVYWKNGTSYQLAPNSVQNGEYYIAVNGNDVYAAGTTEALNGNQVATYWKNGTKYELADSSLQSYANRVVIKDNDVYISGYTALNSTGEGKAAYWKNGIQNTVQAATYSGANDMAISGTDIYLGGYVGDESGNTYNVCYWKNGIQKLTGQTTTNPFSVSIAVNGSDVYMDYQTGLYAQYYWKNGSLIKFTNDLTASVNRIYVMPH